MALTFWHERWKDAGVVRFLVVLMVVSSILSLASTMASLFDVRDYYSLGRSCFVLLGVAGTALYLLLAAAVLCGKSWAHKSAIVFNLLSVVGLSLAVVVCPSDFFVSLLDILQVVIDFVVVGGLLRHAVRKRFDADGQSDAARSANSRMCCMAFWGCVVALALAFALMPLCHKGSEVWEKDAAKAAWRGSQDARYELLAWYEENCPEEQEAESVRYARQKVESAIERVAMERDVDSALVWWLFRIGKWVLIAAVVLVVRLFRRKKSR